MIHYIMVNIKNPNTDECEPMTPFWKEFRLGPDVIVKINHRDELMAHNTQFNNYIYANYLLFHEQKVVIFQDKPSNLVKEWTIPIQCNEETFFKIVEEQILPMVEYYTTLNMVDELK